ncbi:hypothetical protein SAMN06297382_2559 [Amphiplicatus metriothermophilus]|uniref:Uncharacterized protein n=1 Tax=Amphiplicatus metriothermophilus TaxID=1519374 RepID=A0A239PYR1_9PROT|nr:hypothetical protein [Amphiplicatus metriothermophilus]SNT75116.1 hypothetical protein SAMN06297382_2559 [Amphiplicatus metriothermophilus]
MTAVLTALLAGAVFLCAALAVSGLFTLEK